MAQEDKKTDETIADIVREMRAVGWLDKKSTDTIPRSLHALGLRTYADRLKAAYEREVGSYKDTIKLWCDRADELRRKCDEQYAELKHWRNEVVVSKNATTTKENLGVGNAAKMREALEAVIEVGYPHNFQREAPHIRGYCYDITKAIEKCFAALADPPRNCDLHDTKDKAREVFQNLRGHRILADVSLWDDRDEIEAMFDWLFAELKGGVKK